MVSAVTHLRAILNISARSPTRTGLWLFRPECGAQGYFAERTEFKNESKSEAHALTPPPMRPVVDRLTNLIFVVWPSDAGQLDGSSIIAPKPLRERVYRRVEVEDHAAGRGVPDHIVLPDKGHNPRCARDRREQARRQHVRRG